MANYLFKFSTLGSAKFVVERLNQMGVKAAYMPSGYICVDSLTEATKKVIKDSLGTHVAATGIEDLTISKYAGTGQGKTKSTKAKTVEEPKSPPTANSKNLKKYGKTANTQIKGDVKEAAKKENSKSSTVETVRTLAYEALKSIVQKSPDKYPNLSKLFGSTQEPKPISPKS